MNTSDNTLLKLYQIIGDKKRGIPAVLPVSRSAFLNRVREGRYPQPIQIGARSIAWKASDINALLEQGI